MEIVVLKKEELFRESLAKLGDKAKDSLIILHPDLFACLADIAGVNTPSKNSKILVYLNSFEKDGKTIPEAAIEAQKWGEDVIIKTINSEAISLKLPDSLKNIRNIFYFIQEE